LGLGLRLGLGLVLGLGLGLESWLGLLSNAHLPDAQHIWPNAQIDQMRLTWTLVQTINDDVDVE